MKEKRKYFYLDDFEHRLLVGCLIGTIGASYSGPGTVALFFWVDGRE